ncbi:DUF2723 domain-containing protein [Patescibacteria group bacterium]
MKRTGLLLTLLAFAVYFYTLPPSVTSYGDSSEMITAAYTFTAAHPPGYPLYTILGKLFTLLPLKTIAWRVHLSSAIFGALTVYFVYQILQKLSKNWLASTLTTTLLAFAHSFWLYNITAEVFSLNNLMATLVIYQAICWREKVKSNQPKASRHLFLATFFLALGLSNHYSVILVAPGLLFVVLITQRKILLKKSLQLALVFLLGLLPYLQIVYSASQTHPPAYGNLPTWKRFFAYVLRLDYGGPVSAGAIISPPQTPPDTFYYFKLLAQQFTPLGFLAIIVGLWLIYKKSLWEKMLPFILYIFAGLFVFLRYLTQIDPQDLHVVGVAERFSLLSFVPFALCLGVSLGIIFKILETKKPILINIFSNPRIGMIIVLALTSWQIARTWPQVNKNNYWLAHQYGLNILSQVEDNAIIFSTDDLTNSTLDYFIQVEKLKPQVTVISSAFVSNQEYQKELKITYPDLYQTSSQYEYDIIRDIIKTQQNKRPLYFVMLDDPYPLGFNGNPNRFVPKGLVLLATSNLVMAEVQDELESIDWWSNYNQDGLNKKYSEPFAQLTVNAYAFRHRINATVYMEHLDLYSYARKEAEASLAIKPHDNQTKRILERLDDEFKDHADDFRPKKDDNYGKEAKEHLKIAQELAQTPSVIKNFNLHRSIYETQLTIGKEETNADAYGLLGTLYEYFNCWLIAGQNYAKATRLDPENPQWPERLKVMINAGVLPEKPPEGII